MKQSTKCVIAILISIYITMGVAAATPLATFATLPAQDYINFPFGSEDVGSPPFQASGVLPFTQPTMYIFAMGTDYSYDSSLIAYFEFVYGFIGDHGETVTDQYFQVLFDSPADYINVGRIPATGLPFTQTFDAIDVITDFNSTFHGLQDNTWWIYGFRASVRNIYQPVPEPATMLLLCIGLVGLLGANRWKRPSDKGRRS